MSEYLAVWLAQLGDTLKHTFETPPARLHTEMLFTEINAASVGLQFVVFPCEIRDGGEKRSDQQMQINSCLCTFFHAAASKWGRDAGLPPLSLGEREDIPQGPLAFVLNERQFIKCFSLSLLIGWLCSSPCLAHSLPTVHSGSSFDLKRSRIFFQMDTPNVINKYKNVTDTEVKPISFYGYWLHLCTLAV